MTPTHHGSRRPERHGFLRVCRWCSVYDHLVITGRAKGPVYLKIMDDDVEICDAGDLWGNTDVYEASEKLTELGLEHLEG